MQNNKVKLEFEFECKCGNDNLDRFIQQQKNSKHFTLLCIYCERKYEIEIYTNEIL